MKLQTVVTLLCYKTSVVIGCDMREHSARFARLTAAAFIAKGFTVKWFELYVHTPMVPFAVDYFKAAAGVMITASHNPKEDNGYIVYGPDACQINAPVDGMIHLSILKNLEPITWNVEAALASPRTQYVLGIILTAYRSKVRQFLGSLTAGKAPAFLYTPLHGVGLGYLNLVLHSPQADFEDWTFDVVPEQAAPDLTFPTVKYPNPEEVEALDLAKATAEKKQLRLIFANDPDAGRFAVAEKVGDHWFDFTGDQIGVLLAHYLMTKFPPKPPVPCFLLASAVSSQLLSHMAPDMGFHYAETLTGFKWLGQRSIQLEAEGSHVLFAYEEALGYMFPQIVRDKDGIVAAAVFGAACSEWGSPYDELQRLYERYGYFTTFNTYWKSPTLQNTLGIFHRYRHEYPDKLGCRRVMRWRDMNSGWDSADLNKRPDLPLIRANRMITCWLEGISDDFGVRFTFRESGTEPKLKSEKAMAINL